MERRVLSHMYRGMRPVKRRVVRVSEIRPPRGVRKVAVAGADATMGAFDVRPMRREIYAITAARLGDFECK